MQKIKIEILKDNLTVATDSFQQNFFFTSRLLSVLGPFSLEKIWLYNVSKHNEMNNCILSKNGEEHVVPKTPARRSERMTCAVLKMEDSQLSKSENFFPELVV